MTSRTTGRGGGARGVDEWPVDTVAAGVTTATEVVATHGPVDHRFALASVTKPFAAVGVLLAVQDGAIHLDEPAGPPGATHPAPAGTRVRPADDAGRSGHRASAAAGSTPTWPTTCWATSWPNESERTSPPTWSWRSSSPWAWTRHSWTAHQPVTPLPPSATCWPSPANCCAPICSTTTCGANWRPCSSPSWMAWCPATAARRRVRGDWASRFEATRPRTGPVTSQPPHVFGHFGQSGTWLWVDRAAGVAAVALTDRDFGPWAVEAWAPFNDRLAAAVGATT